MIQVIKDLCGCWSYLVLVIEEDPTIVTQEKLAVSCVVLDGIVDSSGNGFSAPCMAKWDAQKRFDGVKLSEGRPGCFLEQ